MKDFNLKKINVGILVGGLGKRLRPLTFNTPKPLLKINKKPFLHFLLSKLSSLGIKKVKLLTGYKSEKIRNYCKNGERWGLDISYSKENKMLGTAGALLNAFDKPSQEPILVMNGDSYFDIDIKNFLHFHKNNKAPVSVYSIYGELTSRGAIYFNKKSQIIKFAEKTEEGYGFFNAGAYLFNQKFINILKEIKNRYKFQNNFSLEKDVFPILLKSKKLYAFPTYGSFIDIGTHKSFEDAKYFFRAKENGRGAIFFDRDGVINKYRKDYVKSLNEFIFEDDIFEALKLFSKTNLLLFIVTNQSIINRKLITPSKIKKIHRFMLNSFAKENIKIKEIFICPHKPEEACDCRKPKIGLLLKAQRRFNIDLTRSFIIGDSTADILMGNIVGAKTILLKRGLKGLDGIYHSKPDFVAKNLFEAYKYIKNTNKINAKN
jgi:histidinol-phosphate phosphatase family protein